MYERLKYFYIKNIIIENLICFIIDIYFYFGLDIWRNCCFMLYILYFKIGIFLFIILLDINIFLLRIFSI